MSSKTIRHNLDGVLADLRGFRDDLVGLRDQLLREAADAMEASLGLGENVMHQMIEQAVTPTGLRREQVRGGHPGRIDTGAYFDGVEHDIEADSDERIVGHLGWLGEKRPYFQEQEDGFTVNGREVEGVHSLVNGFAVASAEFERELRSRVGNASIKRAT